MRTPMIASLPMNPSIGADVWMPCGFSGDVTGTGRALAAHCSRWNPPAGASPTRRSMAPGVFTARPSVVTAGIVKLISSLSPRSTAARSTIRTGMFRAGYDGSPMYPQPDITRQARIRLLRMWGRLSCRGLLTRARAARELADGFPERLNPSGQRMALENVPAQILVFHDVG